MPIPSIESLEDLLERYEDDFLEMVSGSMPLMLVKDLLADIEEQGRLVYQNEPSYRR